MKTMKIIQAGATLTLMIISWVAMAELLQGLESQLHRPYFTSWFVHAGYIWFAFPWAALLYWRCATQPGVTLANPGYPLTSWKHIASTSVWMAWLLTLVAWFWYLSLPLTQVGANTTVYQSASVFVFIFSIFLLNEAVTLRKIFSVALSVLGVGLIASTPGSSDSSQQDHSIMGYVFLVISVLLYALYEVLYKYCIEEADPAKPEALSQELPGGQVDAQPLLATEEGCQGSLQRPTDKQTAAPSPMAQMLLELEFPMLLSALVGVVSIVSQWPVFFLLDALPAGSLLHEANNVSFSQHDWVLLATNSFLDSWYYMLLVFGIALTGPVFMSVGVMLVSPVSIVVDWFLHGTELRVASWLGVAAVIAGFAVLQVETKLPVLENRIVLRRTGWCPLPYFAPKESS